jgi:hypothetical protein
MPLAARAAAVSARDARAVRAVIKAQLQAFSSGQAERAFSYASAAIRTQFGDATSFMTMVLTGYPVLLQPAATSFFVPESVAEGIVQKVQMRDRAGRLWVVTYQLQLQEDSAWRINGCLVEPAPSLSSA